MSQHVPRDAAPGAPDGRPPRAAPPASDAPARSALKRLLHAATAGTEIIISVLAALVFFLVFTLGLSALMPSGISLTEVVQPAGYDGNDGTFAGSLDEFGNIVDRLNPVAAILTVLNTTVKRRAAGEIVWGTVPTGSPLHEGDAVQTTRDGTALLTFGRGKKLQLEQNSLMIVHTDRTYADSGGDTPSVHVMLGELWGNVAREGSSPAAVHVTSPGAETRVTTGQDTAATQFRIAVRRDQVSVLSVYHGAADVVSHGQTVHVQANQYVSVDSVRGIASPPAALPSAPALVSPDGGATFSYRELAPQVQFRWERVAGADGYRLIVSRSPEFEGVVIDQRVATTSFTFGNFKSGPYYWRVSALHGGAEGPPSAPRAVVVSNMVRAPRLRVDFPSGAIESDHYTLAGVAEPGVRVLVAGEPAPTDASGRFQAQVTLKRGFNILVVEAIDRVGNTTYKSKVVEAKF